MEWSLTLLALSLLAVAAVSRRLSGTPLTPAMLFVAFGLLAGPALTDAIDLTSTGSTVRTRRERVQRRHLRTAALRRGVHRERPGRAHAHAFQVMTSCAGSTRAAPNRVTRAVAVELGRDSRSGARIRWSRSAGMYQEAAFRPLEGMALDTQVAVARRRYSVLAVDGGGIRGVIPAVVLREIEQRTGRRIADLFDLVAGTSTGGIIALGLTKPNGNNEAEYRAKDLVSLYVDHGGEIFHEPFLRRVRNLGGIVGVRYPANAIEAVLSDRFGDTKLSEALTEVVVPSYDLSRPGPFYFKRRYPREEPKWDVPMASVARATSAAPTYFDPAPLPPFNGEAPHALVDGGVFANNPVVSAYAEALDLWPGEDVDIRVVSIGTGDPPQIAGDGDGIPVTFEKARSWGLAHWARPVLHVVFDGVEKTAEWQLKRLRPEGDGGMRRYHRLQSTLPTANHALDDASPRNLGRLLADAETLLMETSEALDEICAQLRDVAVERDARRLALRSGEQPQLEP